MLLQALEVLTVVTLGIDMTDAVRSILGQICVTSFKNTPKKIHFTLSMQRSPAAAIVPMSKATSFSLPEPCLASLKKI